MKRNSAPPPTKAGRPEDASAPRALPFQQVEGGARLAVRLTPRASKAAIAGVILESDGRPVLQVRVAAPPVDGEANAALVAFLAKTLGMRASDVSIESGHTARRKIVLLRGDGPALAARLEALIAG